MSTAIVIGGSMAGMSAARALADHVDRVLVFDRDSYPASTTHRIGVPQSHHAHALLARGMKELEELFPGFEAEMAAAGAPRLDFAERFAVLRRWGWAPRCQSGLETLWASRPLVEGVVRNKLRQVKNVELHERSSVQRLLIANKRVTGVVLKDEAGKLTEVAGELVVDASGRGTKSAKWWEAEGLPLPREEIVEAFAGYASRFYKRPPKDKTPADWWWDGLWVEGIPPDFRRGGVAFPLEGHRWLVTAVGFGRDYPPTDEKGFLEYLESLASPIIRRVLDQCEPESDIVGNRSTTNRFRHYETWSAELDGFLAIGDSVCAYNPVYGQGMSVSAVCASILASSLRSVGASPSRLPKAHFAAQAKFLTGVWGLAAGADFIWPTTQGDRPFGSKLVQPYLEWFMETVHSEPRALRALIPIFHLIEDPSRAMAPGIFRMVVGSTVRRRIGQRSLRSHDVPRGSLPPNT